MPYFPWVVLTQNSLAFQPGSVIIFFVQNKIQEACLRSSKLPAISPCSTQHISLFMELCHSVDSVLFKRENALPNSLPKIWYLVACFKSIVLFLCGRYSYKTVRNENVSKLVVFLWGENHERFINKSSKKLDITQLFFLMLFSALHQLIHSQYRYIWCFSSQN